MASTDDYLKLITSEHADKPDYLAVIKVLVSGFSDGINTCLHYAKDFDLDLADGHQLDVIGLWVGVSRVLTVPVAGAYFSWDSDPALGWESGSWRGAFDSGTMLSVLPDDAYRILIRSKIAANNWDGTIPGAQAVYAIIFNGARAVIIQDNQDMSMVIGFVGTPMSALEQAILIGGNLPLKPAGVQIRTFALPPSSGPLFAWDVSSSQLTGWGTGQYAIELQPT